MPFFPDSTYGMAYLGALLMFGVITLLGPNKAARNILAVLILQWLTTRLIDVYDHDNFGLWLIQDYTIFTALLFCRDGKPALACAFLQLIVVLFDSYSLVASGSFEGAAAVAETIGYLSMVIMAGGAHAGGKLVRNRRFGLSGALGNMADIQKRLPYKLRSRVSHRRNKNTQEPV